MASSAFSRVLLPMLLIWGLGFAAYSETDSATAPPALVPRSSTTDETPCWVNDEAPASPEAILEWFNRTESPVQVARCLSPLLLNSELREAALSALDFAAYRALGQAMGPRFSEALTGGWESVAPVQSLPDIVFRGGPWRLPQQIQSLLGSAYELERAGALRKEVEARIIPLLGRCGGAAAVAWLKNRTAMAELGPATIQALANIGSEDAHHALAQTAQRGEPPFRALALACLALHDANVEIPLATPGPSTPYASLVAYYFARRGKGPDWRTLRAGDRPFASGCALYTADSLAQQGQHGMAIAVLQDALANAADSRQRRAALQQLARVSPDAARVPAISLAQDRSVGADARAILAADPEAAPEIRRAYQQGDTGLRAALLEVAARYIDESLQDILSQAGSSTSPSLRFLAASLDGREPSPQDALETAESGPHWLQHRALRALLDSFHGEAIAGDAQVAAQGFRALADSDAPMWCRAEALEALGRVGTLEDLPFLEHYRPHAELGRAASTALARIAAEATEAGEAAATLEALRERTGFQEAVQAAAAVMVERGVAGHEIAQSQGYVTHWELLGPFRRVMSLPPFLPPSTSDPPSVIVSGEEEFRWQPVATTGIPACVSLESERGTTTYFAYAEVLASAFESVRIEVRASGPWRLWINGDATGEGEGVRPESRYVPHASGLLNPGINRVLLQYASEQTSKEYCVRFLNRQGRPIDLLAQQMPDSGASQVGLGRSAAESILNATP